MEIPPSPESWGRASQQHPVLGEGVLGDPHTPKSEGSWGVKQGPTHPAATGVPGLAQAASFQSTCHRGHGGQHLDSGTVPTHSCSPNVGPGSHHASVGTGPCNGERPLGDPALHVHRDAPCLQPGCPKGILPPDQIAADSAPPMWHCLTRVTKSGVQPEAQKQRSLSFEGFGMKCPF